MSIQLTVEQAHDFWGAGAYVTVIALVIGVAVLPVLRGLIAAVGDTLNAGWLISWQSGWSR